MTLLLIACSLTFAADLPQSFSEVRAIVTQRAAQPPRGYAQSRRSVGLCWQRAKDDVADSWAMPRIVCLDELAVRVARNHRDELVVEGSGVEPDPKGPMFAGSSAYLSGSVSFPGVRIAPKLGFPRVEGQDESDGPENPVSIAAYQLHFREARTTLMGRRTEGGYQGWVLLDYTVKLPEPPTPEGRTLDSSCTSAGSVVTVKFSLDASGRIVSQPTLEGHVAFYNDDGCRASAGNWEKAVPFTLIP